MAAGTNIASVKNVKPNAQRVMYHGKTESVLYHYGSIMMGKAAEDGSTAAKMIAATSGCERVLGMLNTIIAAADTDYATAGAKKPVIVDEHAIWEFTVSSGTADANDPQGYIDLADGVSVDVTASTVDLIFVTKFISATKLRGEITGWYNQRPSTN